MGGPIHFIAFGVYYKDKPLYTQNYSLPLIRDRSDEVISLGTES